jgi:hypothetical protein
VYKVLKMMPGACNLQFFLNENRGATPPGNRNHILTEEIKIKLQRGGTYTLPNQWLGNEGGQAKRKTTAETATKQHYKKS